MKYGGRLHLKSTSHSHWSVPELEANSLLLDLKQLRPLSTELLFNTSYLGTAYHIFLPPDSKHTCHQAIHWCLQHASFLQQDWTHSQFQATWNSLQRMRLLASDATSMHLFRVYKDVRCSLEVQLTPALGGIQAECQKNTERKSVENNSLTVDQFHTSLKQISRTHVNTA